MPRKILFLLLAGIMFPTLWSSCENDSMEIGANWVDVHTRTMLIDTCTVTLSSVLLDSVPTSGGSRIFAGVYRSQEWGKTKTSSFLTFGKTTDYTHNSDPHYNNLLRFDSLMLILKPDSMFSGDTTRLMTLNVHRLQKQVELNDQRKLYGHSTFPYDPTPLASKTFRPGPYRGRDLEIRLPDELGSEFLRMLIKQEPSMESNDDFKKYFNGLVLSGSDENQAIVGFKAADSLCYLRLYYHSRAGQIVEHQLDFPQETTTLFTRVESDRTGTPLEGISFKNNDIPSSRSNNLAYIEGLTGIYTKIEFPHLNKILELGDHGTIVSANLLIYPLRGTYGRQNYSALPPRLLIYVSNEQNVTIGSIVGQNDQMQTGNLRLDMVHPENTYYSYDITEFVKNQLGKIGVQKRNLQMIGDQYGYALNNLIVPNQSQGDRNIKLQILYSIYDE